MLNCLHSMSICTHCRSIPHWKQPKKLWIRKCPNVWLRSFRHTFLNRILCQNCPSKSRRTTDWNLSRLFVGQLEDSAHIWLILASLRHCHSLNARVETILFAMSTKAAWNCPLQPGNIVFHEAEYDRIQLVARVSLIYSEAKVLGSVSAVHKLLGHWIG